jgi:hypothetical protein
VMPMVRDAIEAGSPLMKTIRVFVSSTGDVQKERILADRVIRSVAAEFAARLSGNCIGRSEERSDVGEQRVGQRFALGAKLGRAASAGIVPRSRSVTCSRTMSPTKAACQIELGRSTLNRDIQARDHA